MASSNTLFLLAIVVQPREKNKLKFEFVDLSDGEKAAQKLLLFSGLVINDILWKGDIGGSKVKVPPFLYASTLTIYFVTTTLRAKQTATLPLCQFSLDDSRDDTERTSSSPHDSSLSRSSH